MEENKMSEDEWTGSVRESEENKLALSMIVDYLGRQDSIYCPDGFYQLGKGFAHSDVKGPCSGSVEGLLAMVESEKPTFRRLKEDTKLGTSSIEKIVETSIKNLNQVSIEIGGFRHKHLEKVNSLTGDIVISASIIPNYIDKEQPYRLLSPKMSILVNKHKTTPIDLENNCCIDFDKDFNPEKGYSRISSGHIFVTEGLIDRWVGNANYYGVGEFPVVLAPGKSLDNYSHYFLVHEGMFGFRGSFKDIDNMLEKAEEIAKYLESPNYESRKIKFDADRLNEIAETYKFLYNKQRMVSERYDAELRRVRKNPKEHFREAKRMQALNKENEFNNESFNYFGTFDISFQDSGK